MKNRMDSLWDEAAANPGEKIPVGRVVICDLCDADYTGRPECGGFLFGSKAVCPACALRFRAEIARYGEERYIRGECPVWMSFADWVRAIRGPDAFVCVTTGKP